MKEKTKEDYLIAFVQVEASNYTSYAFIKEDRMTFFEAVGCYLVQITMRFLKTMKTYYSGKKNLLQIAAPQ